MNIGQAIGSFPDPKLYKEDTGLVSNNDGIGVEIELENICYFSHLHQYPQIYGFWKTVEDGSLRNGTEFIFDGALKGANITSALDILSNFLEVYRYNGEPVRVTERCSVHVHLDVRELQPTQLTNLIMVYMFLERLLFHYVNPTRSKNNYCRPLTDSSFKYSIHKIRSFTDSNSDTSNLVHYVRLECDKYSALNVLPITKYGSVEFRHHHGTTDTSQIKEWINIILAIKNISREYSIEAIKEMYEANGAKSLILNLFSGTKLGDKEYLDGVEDLDIFLHKGYIDLKEILEFNNLIKLTNTKKISKVRPENTLFHRFKKAKGFVKDEPKKVVEEVNPAALGA